MQQRYSSSYGGLDNQENVVGHGAKQFGGHQQQGRRALGDIGNARQGLAAVGQKPEAGRSGVLTRRAAKQLATCGVTQEGNAQARDSWGGRPRTSLRPRDGNVSVVAAEQEGIVVEDDVVMEKRPAAQQIDEVDVADAKNPLAAVDFVRYIYQSYRKTEQKVVLSSTYMSRQQDINEKMRSILVDWLVDVHLKFKLVPETLYLTVNLIDRFLMVKSVSRKHLQLVGVTAMLVASKYEEIWAPEVRDFVYISDRAYNRDQILNMEKIMLNSLKFNLTVPTHYHFLHRFLKVAGLSEDTEAVHYATYLVELALPDYSMLRFAYSKIAAAAVSATLGLFGFNPMPEALMRHSGYTLEELQDCLELLNTLYHRAPEGSLTAVYKKFSMEKFSSVSTRGAPAGLPMEL